MELAIVGFPQSGKTTVFQALTGGKGETMAAKGARASLGAVKVPDPRLAALSAIFRPKKVVPAEVTYLDIPSAPAGLGKGKGIEGQFLNDLSRADALIHVVQAFQNDNGGPIEAEALQGEVSAMEMELALSDLTIIERRLERIDATLKGAQAQEREAARREEVLLMRLKEGLERDIPVREQSVSPEEECLLHDFQLLTAKPALAVLNICEARLPQAAQVELSVQPPEEIRRRAIALCGKLEAELAELEEEEAQEFREAAGIQEPSLQRMIRLSHEALDLVTFLTTANQEVRAWSIRQGTAAPQAAGKIHTDMQRGFIRAEVVSFDDLVSAGGIAEARKRGVLRLEGKSYIVREGDVITFLFNL